MRELAAAIRRVEDAMISMKKDREADREEVKGMVGRLVEESKRLFILVRDGGEGRRALIEEVQDCKRDIAEMKVLRQEFRDEVKEKFEELEVKLDAIERQLRRGSIELRMEDKRGGWLMVSSLVTALLGAIAAILIAIFK